MISAEIKKLKKWLSSSHNRLMGLDLRPDELYELRNILGTISSNLNKASLIFKTANRSPSPQIISSLNEILAEIEHFEELKSVIEQIKKLFDENGIYAKEQSKTIILNLLHYIERAHFTKPQISKLQQIASSLNSNNEGFPDEVNQAGLDNLLKNSIYNTSNGSDKTLKVVREVLQNAVDATDPRQHPHLENRENFKPEIYIESHFFKANNNYFIDLIIEDKGIGMDWDVLSKKFFVTFESGKGSDTGAAGGFGIAKALIQDAPEHGWSIDTNGIHSSRFHKNIFMGTRKEDYYQPPTSEIKKNAQGTTLTLHGLPFVSNSDLAELCTRYATNGRVKIFLEGKEIAPKFLLESSNLKSIDNISSIPDIMSGNDSEKEVAERVFQKQKDQIQKRISEVGLVSDEKTSYKFYLKKTELGTSGRLYVMVNGQFQFDKEKYIPKIDIICSIETKARPGSEDYPLDPGREYLRGKINEKIDGLIESIKELSQEIGKDELFKDGIESIVVNEDANPMIIEDDEADESTATKKEQMMELLQGSTGSAGFTEFGFKSSFWKDISSKLFSISVNLIKENPENVDINLDFNLGSVTVAKKRNFIEVYKKILVDKFEQKFDSYFVQIREKEEENAIEHLNDLAEKSLNYVFYLWEKGEIKTEKPQEDQPKNQEDAERSEKSEKPQEDQPKNQEDAERSEKPEDEKDEKDEIKQVAEELVKKAGPNSIFDKKAIEALVEDAWNTKSKIERTQKLKNIVEGLTTPGHVLIQKGFVARKTMMENTPLLAEMLILWQKTLKLIIQKLGTTAKFSSAKGRPFIPGLIFSKDVLGLWMSANPNSGRRYASVSINPLTLAAAINPKYFMDRIAEDEITLQRALMGDKEESKGSRESDTPINRTAKFIFHIATHEICHLLFPEMGYGSDNFHKNITRIELICHDVFEEVRREVRLHMPGLKKSARKLITLVEKTSKKSTKHESFDNWHFVRSKFKNENVIFSEFNINLAEKIKINSFREFLKEFAN